MKQQLGDRAKWLSTLAARLSCYSQVYLHGMSACTVKNQFKNARLEDEHGSGKSVAEVREIYANKRKTLEVWSYSYTC